VWGRLSLENLSLWHSSVDPRELALGFLPAWMFLSRRWLGPTLPLGNADLTGYALFGMRALLLGKVESQGFVATVQGRRS
jgi:hypothetical protein